MCCAVLLLAGCCQPPNQPNQPDQKPPESPRLTVRNEFILLNDIAAKTLGSRALIVNVGTGPDTATGDPIWLALEKVRLNFEHISGSSAPDAYWYFEGCENARHLSGDPIPDSCLEAIGKGNGEQRTEALRTLRYEREQ